MLGVGVSGGNHHPQLPSSLDQTARGSRGQGNFAAYARSLMIKNYKQGLVRYSVSVATNDCGDEAIERM